MAIRDLFFNILARDKTGSAFDQVKGKLRGVEGAAASASERMKRMGRGMVGFGAAATAATAPLFLAFRDSLQLYDVQARAEAKVRQAVESTGKAAGFTAKELFGMASGLQNVTRFGDEEILAKVTGQLLTFTNIAGDQFKLAQERALDLATVLEGDVQSASIMLGKALNDPVKGLSAMSRAGVTFSRDQEEVIKSLAETGQIAEAQTIILDELARQYGGQARKAAEAGIGPVDQLNNAWGDLKETVGKIIAELLPPIVRFFQGLVDGFQSLPGPVQKFIVLGGALAVVLGPVVAILGGLVLALGAIGAPVAAAVAGFAALTAGVAAFWPEIKAAAGAVVEAVGVVQDYLAAFAQAHIDAFNLAAEIVPETVRKIHEWLTGKLSGAFDFVVNAVGKVKGAFFDLYDAVVGNSYVPDMVDEIGQHFGRLPGEMVLPAQEATGAVGGAFATLGQSAVESLKGMARNGKFTFEGFARDMIGAANRMADQIIDDAFARLADAAAGLGGAIEPGTGARSGGGGLGGVLSGFFSSIFSGLPGFNKGADFITGGRSGIDRNVVAFRANDNERVRVTRPGDRGEAPAVNVTIQTPDPRSFFASRAQVSAQIARAVAAGQRNL